jgi:hypothetical protein
VIRYRFMAGSRPIGPWRPAWRQALHDARDGNMVTRDGRFGALTVRAPGWIDAADNLKIA